MGQPTVASILASMKQQDDFWVKEGTTDHDVKLVKEGGRLSVERIPRFSTHELVDHVLVQFCSSRKKLFVPVDACRPMYNENGQTPRRRRNPPKRLRLTFSDGHGQSVAQCYDLTGDTSAYGAASNRRVANSPQKKRNSSSASCGGLSKKRRGDTDIAVHAPPQAPATPPGDNTDIVHLATTRPVTQQNLTGAVAKKSTGAVNNTHSLTPQRDDARIAHSSRASHCVLLNQTQDNRGGDDTGATEASVATREPVVATLTAEAVYNEASPPSPRFPTSELAASNPSVYSVLKYCIIHGFAGFGFLVFCLWVNYWWVNGNGS
jgi:hypothetical protein